MALPAIQVRLSPDLLAQIRAAPQAVSVSVANGVPTLRINDKAYSGDLIPESTITELYRTKESPKSGSNATPLILNGTYEKVGDIARRLVINDINSSRDVLESKVAELRRSKDAARTTIIETDVPPRPRSATAMTASHTVGSSSVGSSSASPTNPQITNTTSHSLPASPRTLPVVPLSSQSIKALPVRVAQFLAMKGACTAQTLAERTRAPLPDILKILAVYGKVTSDGKYTLADKFYSELRIWTWKYYTETQREFVLSEARAAYDRLKYSPTHPARRNLLPETDNATNEPEKRLRSVPKTNPANEEPSVPIFPATRPAVNTHTLFRRQTKPQTTVAQPVAQTVATNPSRKRKSDVLTASDSDSDSSRSSSRSPKSRTTSNSSVSSESDHSDSKQHMQTLAKKFRLLYPQYRSLYMTVRKSRHTDRRQYDKLLALHEEVKSLKERLWRWQSVHGT